MTGLMDDSAQRRKYYGGIFLASGLAIGAVGLLTVWAPNLLSSASIKLICTFLILASASAVLFIMTFRKDDLVSKNMSVVIAVCTLGMAGLLIAEIWFDLLQDVFFSKLFVTLAVLAGLGGFVMAVWDDFFEQKRLKDQNYID